jgi:hypothetical protein
MALLRLPDTQFFAFDQLSSTKVFVRQYFNAFCDNQGTSGSARRSSVLKSLDRQIFRLCHRLLNRPAAVPFGFVLETMHIFGTAQADLVVGARAWLESSPDALSALQHWLVSFSSGQNQSSVCHTAAGTYKCLERLIVSDAIANCVLSSSFMDILRADAARLADSAEANDLITCLDFYSSFGRYSSSGEEAGEPSDSFFRNKSIRIRQVRRDLPGRSFVDISEAIVENANTLGQGTGKVVDEEASYNRGTAFADFDMRTKLLLQSLQQQGNNRDAGPASSDLKARILSLAYDPNDDELDDTYETQAMQAGQSEGIMPNGTLSLDETLYPVWVKSPNLFDRKSRKDKARLELQQKLGTGPEVVEGWATMLKRDERRQHKLADQFSFRGEQVPLAQTKWSSK